jgi:hypothetical protein
MPADEERDRMKHLTHGRLVCEMSSKGLTQGKNFNLLIDIIKIEGDKVPKPARL